MIEISLEKFEEQVKEKKPFVVDFWAGWCAPCRTLAPILEELSEEFKGKIGFFKVNIDENPELSQKQQITSVPTVLIFKNGEIVDRFNGVFSKKEIKKKLEIVL